MVMFGTMLDNNVAPLQQFIRRGDSSDLQLKAFICNNLGNPTLLVKLPMYDFFRMSDVANERGENGKAVTQRKLDPEHATKLARYILKGLIATSISIRKQDNIPVTDAHIRLQRILGTQPYLALQPIVANLRTAGPQNLRAQQLETADREGIGVRLWLGQRDIMWVVDGQHRRMAMKMIIDFLEDIRREQKYPSKKQSSVFPHGRDERIVPPDELDVWLECYEITRTLCTVSVELHLGLGVLEERQLFHDLNNLAKKMEKSLALEFDSSNPINKFIQDELLGRGLLKISHGKGDKVDWDDDDGSFTRRDIVAINAHLILNKTNINGAKPSDVNPRLDIAKRFWETVTNIPGFGEEKAKKKTVAAQPVVLKALAKLTYDFAFGRSKDENLLNTLLDGITKIDFSHDNPMWRYYQLSSKQIKEYQLESLQSYLPDSSTGNRDIGFYDNGWMRFGIRHNDIFPIIGDMIRWTLKLPNRHKNNVHKLAHS
jgi:hypothetical protein